MLKDAPQPPNPEFVAAQEAAFAKATQAIVADLAANPEALHRSDIAPRYRRAAEELLDGKKLTPQHVDDLSHLGTSDAPPGV